MELEAITTLITNIGFPIACVIFLFRYLQKREEAHTKDSEKWAETVNNNTKIMVEMTNKMDTMLKMLEDSYVKQLEIKLQKVRGNKDDEE